MVSREDAKEKNNLTRRREGAETPGKYKNKELHLMTVDPLRLRDGKVSPEEAREVQLRLREQVRIEPLDVEGLEVVAGADLSANQGSDTVYAGFVLLRLPGLEVLERVGIKTQATFPYIPGLLAFREVPPLLEAWDGLSKRPEAVICDGHGYAHPRRFGFACYLGLTLDLPSVGCAKRILVGKHEPVGDSPGDWKPIVDKGETIGAALRLRKGATPVYVSVGHRCDLESAVALVRRCAGKTRVPETTRQAHLFVNELRRGDFTMGDG